jgi:benzoyl-CoA reductase subunit C
MIESPAMKALEAGALAAVTGHPVSGPGRPIMGYLCSYVPQEIIHAAGFLPVRVRGKAAHLRRVDAHLQSYTCALCRSTLDQLLTGELRFLAGAVFAHTCDSMQALADLWRMNTNTSHFVDTVMQPAHLGSSAARVYLIDELGRFRNRLSAFAGQPIDDDTLGASIALYDETRWLIQDLQRFRDRLTVRQYFSILDAAHAMPRERLNPLLRELLIDSERAAVHKSEPRLFLVGAIFDEPRLADVIEDLGAFVAGDDLCSGSRHFSGRVGNGGDPVTALADYYLRRQPCPAKFHPGHDSSRELLDRLQSARAQGVVFVLEKFCEPHAFDHAMILPALEGASIPHLVLEMEQTPSLEALRTRLQAFIEILQGATEASTERIDSGFEGHA